MGLRQSGGGGLPLVVASGLPIAVIQEGKFVAGMYL